MNKIVPPYLGSNNALMTELQKLATKDTAEYFYNLEQQPEFIPNQTIADMYDIPSGPYNSKSLECTFGSLDESKEKLRILAEERIGVKDGFVAEFGCNEGKSYIPLCKRFNEQPVFGFDAFDGLPEDKWEGNIVHKGAFKHKGAKCPFNIPDNGVMIEGWFDKTLPGFDFMSKRAKFLHIDCDVYSSTVTILREVGKYIDGGTVIVFDDYCNHTNWRQGEWKAWKEYCTKNVLSYEYLYVAGMSVAIKIIHRLR